MNINEQLRILREGVEDVSENSVINEAFENFYLLESLTGNYDTSEISLFENASVLTESVSLIDKIFMKLFDDTNSLEKLLKENDLSEYKDLHKDFHKYVNEMVVHFSLTPHLLIERRKYIIDTIDSLPSINKVLDKFREGMSNRQVADMVNVLTRSIKDIQQSAASTLDGPAGKYSILHMRKSSYLYEKSDIKKWKPEIVTQNRAEFIKEVLNRQTKLKGMKEEIKNAISKVDNSNFINKSQVKGLLKKVIDVELYLYNALITTLKLTFLDDLYILRQVKHQIDKLKK